MSLHIDASGLHAKQAHLAGTPSRIERRIAGRAVTATRALLGVARGVVHVQSGDLRDSLSIDGPSPIGDGSIETSVHSPLSYAESEVAKGGDHDYAARTLEAGAGILGDLARDLEAIVIDETGAGRS